MVSRWICTLLTILCVTCGPIATAQPPAPTDHHTLAGAPVAQARRRAIDARSFHRPLSADRIRKWMEISSTCTIAEFELFLDPL